MTVERVLVLLLLLIIVLWAAHWLLGAPIPR